MNKLKVLLLGGTGVLSSEIVLRCVELGYETYTLTRGTHNDELPKGVIPIVGNIREPEYLIDLLKDKEFDVVVDFLSYNPIQLESCLSIFSSRCKQYIFISSSCVFRRAKEDFPLKELSPKPNQNLKYSVNKFGCESFIRGLKDLRCMYTIVRPYITYGDTRIPYGIAPSPRRHWTIIGRIMANKPLFVWTDKGHIPECSLLHSKDFANAFCKLFSNQRAFNEDINIVGEEVQSWLEVAQIIGKACGKENVEIEQISCEELAGFLPDQKEFLKGDRNLDAIFDTSKLHKIISDYNQTICLSDGIAHTIACYKTHGYYDGIDYAFDGAVDRMLVKKGYKNLKFVDYTCSATLTDRIVYLLHRNLSYNSARRVLNTMVKLKNLFRR